MTTIRGRLTIWFTVAMMVVMLVFGIAIVIERQRPSFPELDDRLALEADFANGWLVAKIAFLVAYVGLGIAAFRPTRAAGARALLVGAAVLCFLQVYGIARAHDPLGWLLWLGN